MSLIWFDQRDRNVRLVRADKGDILHIWFECSSREVRLVQCSSPERSEIPLFSAFKLVRLSRSDYPGQTDKYPLRVSLSRP